MVDFLKLKCKLVKTKDSKGLGNAVTFFAYVKTYAIEKAFLNLNNLAEVRKEFLCGI